MEFSQLATWQIIVSTVTSMVAIIISSVTLGWTIYRDAIRKPKFRVAVAKKTIVQRGMPNDGPYLFVDALNLGPIPNKIGLTFARKSWLKRWLLDRKNSSAMIYPDFGHQAATLASTKLEVGDKATFVFPYQEDSLLREDFIQIGVADGFGTIHWCSRRNFRKVKETHHNDFPHGN